MPREWLALIVQLAIMAIAVTADIKGVVIKVPHVWRLFFVYMVCTAIAAAYCLTQ